MNISIYYDKDKSKKTVSVSRGAAVKDVLSKLEINPVTVIVSKENELVPEDEVLHDKDKLQIISVISGG